MIALSNISKTFHGPQGGFKALDDVSLQVDKGGITGVIGSSGAGKSTLLRCVNLLERPDTGQVLVNGKDLTSLKPAALAKERKKIGMIFQHFNLLSSRTVYGNVALPLKLDKTPDAIVQRKVHAMLQLVGIADKALAYPGSLSGGQKQRVAIARALANDPHVLLCDEATSALDPATTRSILQLLRDINRELHLTVLLITHEMEVVKSVCDHVAVMDRGRLAAFGTLDAVMADPAGIAFQRHTGRELPGQIQTNMKSDEEEGLFPVVEISLDGTIAFEQLISLVGERYRLKHKVLRADVEYVGGRSFGRLSLHLRDSKEANTALIRYFIDNHIKYTIRGYV